MEMLLTIGAIIILIGGFMALQDDWNSGFRWGLIGSSILAGGFLLKKIKGGTVF